MSVQLRLPPALQAGGTSRFTKPPSEPKEINHEMCLQVWSLDCLLIGMDYEKMKTFLETSREESAAQHTPEVKEFPKPASRPVWRYLDHLTKDRIAA
jgi:hypothetical protein